MTWPGFLPFSHGGMNRTIQQRITIHAIWELFMRYQLRLRGPFDTSYRYVSSRDKTVLFYYMYHMNHTILTTLLLIPISVANNTDKLKTNPWGNVTFTQEMLIKMHLYFKMIVYLVSDIYLLYFFKILLSYVFQLHLFFCLREGS